jgi:anti-sigma regulatory factor (Ser/Thr protein kinase)
MPAEAASVTTARRWLRGWCDSAVRVDLCDDAELVLTELVGNAVRHAGGSMDVEIGPSISGHGVWLCVSDSSSRPVQFRQVDLMAEHGRGLQLIDLLTSRWGVDADRSGKRVWAELE